MIVRRDYKTNLSSQLELMLQSFSYLVMSQNMEDDVVRHNAVVISYPKPTTLALKYSRFNHIQTNCNIV